MAISKSNAGWWAFPISVVTVLSIGVIASMFFVSLGWPIFPQPAAAEEAPAPTEEIISQWSVSPAMAKLTESLEAPPSGWEGTGSIITAPQAPYPFSCVDEGVSPTVALVKNFNVNKQAIQVLATAYPAGLGAKGMASEFNRASSCAGGDAAFSLVKLDGIGTEVYEAVATKSNLKIRTIIWRYGDIVVYLIADLGNTRTYNLASAFHENMMAKLDGACLAANYDDADMTRSPFSGEEFKGFFVGDKVTIPEVKQPKVPADKDFKATKIPAPEIEVREVVLPVKPTAYPVWPNLPTPVEKPVMPAAPAAESPTEKEIRIKAEDTQGPGCGWAFTGSTSPNYNEEEAGKYNAEVAKKATAELKASAKKWQQDLLAYWEKYDEFASNVPVWNAYGTKVDEVTQAWAKIETDWANYREAKAVYDAQVAAKDAFVKAKADATKQYESLIEQCKVQDVRDKENAEKQAADKKKWDEAERKRVAKETKELEARYQREAEERAKKEAEERAKEEAKSPSPSPTPTPDTEIQVEEIPESELPKPRPYVAPEDNTPRVACPAVRPAIMDQAPPTVDDAPKPPADPRPASERD